jgi:site-specific recombinase XerC
LGWGLAAQAGHQLLHFDFCEARQVQKLLSQRLDLKAVQLDADRANQLEVDKRQGAYAAPAAGRVKLGEYAREWLDSKHKLKPSTRTRYQVVLDTFITEHADAPLGDISRQLVCEWVADLSVDQAPASVHKTIGVLRQVLAMAVRENRLVMNPVDGVEVPAVGSLEQRFLTQGQLHRLADAAGPHRPLVYVLGTCGLRFGEVAELRWRNLDLQKL